MLWSDSTTVLLRIDRVTSPTPKCSASSSLLLSACRRPTPSQLKMQPIHLPSRLATVSCPFCEFGQFDIRLYFVGASKVIQKSMIHPPPLGLLTVRYRLLSPGTKNPTSFLAFLPGAASSSEIFILPSSFCTSSKICALPSNIVDHQSHDVGSRVQIVASDVLLGHTDICACRRPTHGCQLSPNPRIFRKDKFDVRLLAGGTQIWSFSSRISQDNHY